MAQSRPCRRKRIQIVRRKKNTPIPPHPHTPIQRRENQRPAVTRWIPAPTTWPYALFPLREADDPRLEMERVTEIALELVDRAEASGDAAEAGPVLHWAHMLKIEQGPDGDWPAAVDARTGAALGTGRTRKPAELLRRLGDWLKSSEFDAAVALADGPRA